MILALECIKDRNANLQRGRRLCDGDATSFSRLAKSITDAGSLRSYLARKAWL
jgi:hypothetical protein